jgi:hypothetical protein
MFEESEEDRAALQERIRADARQHLAEKAEWARIQQSLIDENERIRRENTALSKENHTLTMTV